jgi:hypothetical protein
MPPVGFEPTISAGERPQTYALDRAPTGTSNTAYELSNITELGFLPLVEIRALFFGLKWTDIRRASGGCKLKSSEMGK